MRKLDKKTLDEIGKRLVRADVALSRDIDRITADPSLFDGVLARIKQAEVEPAPRLFSARRVVFSSLASIVVLAAVVVTIGLFRSKPIDVVVHQPVVDAPKNRETKTFADPDRVITPEYQRASTSIRAERISARPTVNVSRRKQPEAQQVRHEGDFYALSYAGDPNETERGGRIVRVDVSRATLFAMGVDVPLENESETVKADLLIGSYGVTRAIRVVK